MTEAQLIDGKVFATRLRNTVADAVNWLGSEHNLVPGLAVLMVGDDPASQIYTRNKAKQTTAAGMTSLHEQLPTETSQVAVLKKIEALNNDRSINGILVQLPLPNQMDSDIVIDTIDPTKDVDGFHLLNAGRLVTGRNGLTPCTPQGCLILLKETLGDLEGANAVIVGRSNIVGKPIAQLLLRENCTVTVAHSRTRNLAELCRRADILVAAVGRPEMIRGDWIRPGATVIDVGINRIVRPDNTTRLVGDVAFSEAVQIADAITPVPGGVGPMTVACLLANCVRATCEQHGLPEPELWPATYSAQVKNMANCHEQASYNTGIANQHTHHLRISVSIKLGTALFRQALIVPRKDFIAQRSSVERPHSSLKDFSKRSCRFCASMPNVATGRASRRLKLMGSPVSSQ